MALRQRLLHDIADLRNKPYPNITFFPHDDITTGCLILTPNGERPLHLTVEFRSNYPISAPKVKMDSDIAHPNVFDDYICASVLDAGVGYTPAYTLKGIAIQLLSFFASESIQQDYGSIIDLAEYRETSRNYVERHHCVRCAFGAPKGNTKQITEENSELMTPSQTTQTSSHTIMISKVVPDADVPRFFMNDLPDEVLLVLCEFLESEELMAFARAWNRIGNVNGIVSQYNVLRTRELQCFVLKKSFTEVGTKLGVGVAIKAAGRQSSIESEFDLISRQAFREFEIRRSVQGRHFQFWLPLPISRRHFQIVETHVDCSLKEIGSAAKISASNTSATVSANVIYSFMNDIMVKLSTQTAEVNKTQSLASYRVESTLKHASDKAIESYYHLFHLLLCLATSDDSIVRAANRTLDGFLRGRTSKTDVPNLGNLLVAVLISDFEMTQELTMSIIKEIVTRNVVWMLDGRSGGHGELSYMEHDAISEYRLAKTFEASKTSYRLLMFLNLFRLTLNRGTGNGRKSLVQLRDEMFDAHGAPPRDMPGRLAAQIKQLQTLDKFPDFLKVMGIKNIPTASTLTTFLRNCIKDSAAKGYSVWAISQEEALRRRQEREPKVTVRPKELQKSEWRGIGGSFLPGKNPGGGRGGGGRGGGRDGRGRR